MSMHRSHSRHFKKSADRYISRHIEFQPEYEMKTLMHKIVHFVSSAKRRILTQERVMTHSRVKIHSIRDTNDIFCSVYTVS